MARLARSLYALTTMLLVLGGFALTDGGVVSLSTPADEAAQRLTIYDLRNLVSAQQQFRAAHRVFARDLAALGTTYRPSAGVRVAIEYADSTYWRARASYDGLPGSCTIEGGSRAITEPHTAPRCAVRR